MKNAGSVEIDRPIEEVFRLTTENVEQWSIIVVEDVVIDEKPGGVGTTFKSVTEEKGQRMEFQGVVTRHEPPKVHAIELTGNMFDIQTEFLFEELSADRTRVTQNAHVQGKGFFKVFMFLFGWMMNKSHCKATKNELNSLKQFCESHSEISAN